MSFHKKLYQLRKKQGLSQEELGDKLNVSRQTISKWELGESTPDLEKLLMLSDYFDTSIDYLVHENGHITQSKYRTNSQKDLMIEKFLTKENKKKAKKGLKFLAYFIGILLAIDILSLIVFAIIKLTNQM